MIAFQSEQEPLSAYDRPGAKEVARLRDETTVTIEAIDQPADLLAEALQAQVKNYSGPMPSTPEELCSFVVRQFKQSATVTAVSAMLQAFADGEVQTRLADFGIRMLVTIRSQSNPALTCDCLATAFGMHISEGRTMEQMARPHGITKQAFSKRGIRICKTLGVDPSLLMRSEESRESYRLKQLQRHKAVREAGLGRGSMEQLREGLARARRHVTGAELRSAAVA